MNLKWNKNIVIVMIMAVLGLCIPAAAEEQYRMMSVSNTNPAYAGLTAAVPDAQSEMPDGGISTEIAGGYFNSSTPAKYTVTSEEGMATVIREHMLRRSTSEILFTYKNSSPGFDWNYDSINVFFTRILEKAVVHDGTPNEGDYLLYHYLSSKQDIKTARSGEYEIRFYAFKYLSTAAQEQTVDTRISALVKELGLDQDGTSDYEAVKKIYDYITHNITFDYEHSDMLDAYPAQFSAYGALVSKKAVCQGFSNLFYRLALEAGVDARIIDGTGNGGPHAWNIVKIGSCYYNLDATWDSENVEAGYSDYEFFLMCNKDFPGHTRDARFRTASFNNTYPMSSTNFNSTVNKVGSVVHRTPVRLELTGTVPAKLGQKFTAKIASKGADDSVSSWSSSNTTVAKVSSTGVVTMTKTKSMAGKTAIITLKMKSGAMASFTVKAQKSTVKATKITVNSASSITLPYGKSFQLKAVRYPVTSTEKITYSSRKSKIAKVSKNGLIKAVSPGSTVITVKAGKKKLQIKVTVPAVKTTKLTNVPASKTLQVKKTYTLKPKRTPQVSKDAITYTSGNTAVASVSKSGKITAKSPGTTEIRVKCGDAQAICRIKVVK